jgi:SAM-dependent methyltransferase
MRKLLHRLKRADELFNEWRLGIDSGEIHTPYDAARPEVRGYCPTFFRDWRLIRPHIVVTPQSSFIDYGAGLGRVTILAATLPFARVIGVEFDPALALRGQTNIERAKSSAKIICADAAAFDIPPNTSTLYICNSFTGSILSSVLTKVQASYEGNPRPIQLICNLPAESAFEPEIRRVDWLKLTHELALSDGRKCLIFAPAY